MNQCLLILDYNVLAFVLKLAVINVGCELLGNFILEFISEFISEICHEVLLVHR